MRPQIPPSPRRILDFGCGTGKATAYLSTVFPGAEVVGADLSDDALQNAKTHFGSDRVSFAIIPELPEFEKFDACYINGVFHNVLPDERQQTLVMIRNLLKPGAHLALFENNPGNPGTRMMMRRIPFDKDAMPLSYLETRRRVEAAGFRVHGTRFLFYMPQALSPLRFMEPLFVNLPLAQYYVLAATPGSA